MKTGIVTTVGKRGSIVIPVALRNQLNIHAGDLMITTEHNEGILITPAVVVSPEKYSTERKAEFILSNATDLKDYKNACTAVRKLGLDPEAIRHFKPTQ